MRFLGKNMIEIAIVEDELNIVQTLKGFLARYAEQYGFEINVHHFGSAEDFLNNYPKNCELVLMDIELPKLENWTNV